MFQTDPRLAEDLLLRNYSHRTVTSYSYHLQALMRYFDRPAHLLSIDQVRAYLLHASAEAQCSWSWWRQAVAALRFYYGITLGRDEAFPRLPHPRREFHLPTVLSTAEVERLIEAAQRPHHRLVLMTMYSAGLRLSEALSLTWRSIDPARMLIQVAQGKGKVDRLVPLSTKLLEALRQYRRSLPENTWVFPGRDDTRPMSGRTVQWMTQRATRRANIGKAVTPHTLRHSYATHMLEAGVDVRIIQRLLGHKQLVTTLRYTHLNDFRVLATNSPLDSLNIALAPYQLSLPGL